MHSEDFRNSNQLIAIAQGEFRVRDFFVDFSEIADDNEGDYRGYWGLISDAALSREEPPSLWLNSGGRDDVSVVVDAESANEFLERFPLGELEELAGAYVLVFADLRVSRNGKKYLAVSDISKMTISY